MFWMFEVILLCGSAICWAKVLNSMVRKGLDQKRDVNRGVAPDPATSRTSDYAFASCEYSAFYRVYIPAGAGSLLVNSMA